MKSHKPILSCVIAAIMFCSLLLSLPQSVFAAETQTPAKNASLTVVYRNNGVHYAGLEIAIYRIAEVQEDMSYKLVEAFQPYPVDLCNIGSQSEWRAIAQTLAAYAVADKIQPTASQITNSAGTVKFENLQPGLYMTLGTANLSQKGIVEFETFMTVLPYPQSVGESAVHEEAMTFDLSSSHPQEDESYNYDVIAYPKSSEFMPVTEDDFRVIKVVKQWKDGSYMENRPENIKVEIYKDGIFKTTVTLSAENNWTYRWGAPLDGAIWTAVEREVPENYTVSIVRNGDTIVLTNIFAGELPAPPITGDNVPVWPCIMLMCLSGCIFILIAMRQKAKH